MALWRLVVLWLAKHLGARAIDADFDAQVLLQVAQKDRLRALEGPTAETERVLIFWAVGSKSRSMHLVQANVAHLREFESLTTQLRFDIFLAHYDRNQAAWKEKLGDWYDENVRFSCEEPGLKFPLAKRALIDNATVPLEHYSWVWFLDEDGDLTKLDPGTLVNNAKRSKGNIVAPALTFPRIPIRREDLEEDFEEKETLDAAANLNLGDCQHHDPKCNFQAPQGNCRFRYVNFIEVSFPMMRPDTWKALATTPNLVNSESIWGLDHTWCSLSARIFDTNPQRSCVIVDDAPIVHINLRTLPKYRDSSQMHKDMDLFHKMRRQFPKDFFGVNPSQFECSPHTSD